jgi:hypothetical protein
MLVIDGDKEYVCDPIRLTADPEDFRSSPKGTVSLVDMENLDWLNQWQWYAMEDVGPVRLDLESGHVVVLAECVLTGLDNPRAAGEVPLEEVATEVLEAAVAMAR